MVLGSVLKTTQILNIISDGKNKPVTLSHISEATGINKSTCSHIISTLMEEGFVKRISQTQGYILGPQVYCLCRHGKYDDKLSEICHPILKWIYKKTGCAVVLAVVENGKKFAIDYIDNENKILRPNKDIYPDDLYRTATGRIIMANMNENELREAFDKNGIPPKGHWDEVKSFEDLLFEISKINGKKTVKTDYIPKDKQIVLSGYAAAVFKNSKCIGAIGVATYSTPDFTDSDEENIISTLLKARAEIGRRLNYT
jgi:DNA-binding IclR family transcriptional regulator